MTDASLSAKVTADIADFVKKFDDVRGSVDKLGSGMTGGVGKANGALTDIKDNISTIGGLLKSGALVEGGKALTEAVTLPLIGLGKEAVLMADKMHQSKIAFTTMLGSADQASAFLRDLQAFAAATPFEFPELVTASKKMLALGFDAKEVIPTLRNVGNATSGLGGGADVMGRIVLALGQMKAKGSVSAEEMKQLAEAGIPAWQALAGAIGVTVPEAMEMAKKKQIDSTTAIAALQGDMAKRFGGLMEQQSQTIQGTLANLHDTVGFIMTDIGRELIETLNIREGLAAVQEFAKGFLDWFKSLDQGTKQVLLVLTGTFAVGGPILVAVGAFMTAMAVVTAPILVGGAIVAGIVAGVALILLNWRKIKDTGTALWTSLTSTVTGAVDKMVAGIDAALGRLKSIMDGVKTSTEAVKGFFYDMWTAVTRRSYVPDMVADIEANMDQLPAKMIPQARRAVTEVKNIFRELEAVGAGGTIGAQVQSLDLSRSSGSRASIAQTVRTIETGKFTFIEAQNEMASVATQTWGSITTTVGTAFAQQVVSGNNWAQTLRGLGTMVLGNFTNMILQMGTQWLVSETTRTAATATANGVIVAGNTAAATASTSIWAGASAAILGFFGSVTAGFTAMAGGLVTALTAVGTFVMGVLGAIAKALTATVFGIAYAGAILLGIAAIAGALAATGNLGFRDGGIGDFGAGTPATLHGKEAIIPLNQRGADFMQKTLGAKGGLGGSPIIRVPVYLNGRQIALASNEDSISTLRQIGVPV